MGGVMQRWQRGFIKYQPDAHFDVHLYGTATSIAGLYTGIADVSLLGREIWPIESTAFDSVFAYKPTGVQVATGSYDTPKATYALTIYVNGKNPLSKLTLDQVAGIFGTPLSPERKPIRVWGDLGLRREWSHIPIQTYNFDYDNDKAVFFRHRLFAARYRWKEITREYSNRTTSDGTTVDSGKLILDVLATDPFGIAVSNPHYANEDVKPLALAGREGEYVFPSRQTVQNRSYPLTRAVYIYINHPPTGPYDAKVLELLRYILSQQGQADVIADSTYLPLPATIVKAELNELLVETALITR
jgi:phosphate transport system substrate-binding protein